MSENNTTPNANDQPPAEAQNEQSAASEATTEQTSGTTEQTSGTTEQTSGTEQEQTSGTEEQTSGTGEQTSGTTDQEQTSGTEQEQTSGTEQEQTSGTEQEQTSGTEQEQTSGTVEQTSGTEQEQTSGTVEQTSGTEQEQTSGTGEQTSGTSEQQSEQPAEQPSEKPAAAPKEEKIDTKLPKEFKRGFDISHYQLERLLDNQKGLFLFAATNHKDDEAATLRIERIDPKHPGLLNEIAVIPYLNDSLSFPRYYEWGEQDDFRWVSCELLGPSLKFVKWKIPKQRFTQYSALHGSLALLRCIEDLHKRGFVHGDIQPDNILIRPNKEHPLVLSNFQMAKRYCWPEGVTELPPMDKTPAKIDITKVTQNNEIVVEDDYGYKKEQSSEQQQQQSESQTNDNNNASTENSTQAASAENSSQAQPSEAESNAEEEKQEGPIIRDPTIFDSVNALQGGEITRVDDLESWYYIMVDMLEGKLPFSVPSGQSATRESILSHKQAVSPETLTKDLPDKLKDVWTYISSLSPTDEPDYDKIGKSIVDTIQELKLIPDDYDWNKLPVRKVKKISAIDFRALNGENNYLPIFDHERNVSQTPPPPPANCSIA